MAFLGELIREGAKITGLRKDNYLKQQKKQLTNLLKKAKNTAFGLTYGFEQILEAEDIYSAFKEKVPIFNYNSMFANWWHRSLNGEKDVCWPGRVNYFALSSGTSESASKHIPVTHDMQNTIKNAGVRQMISLHRNFGVSTDTLTRGALMLGGSTDLMRKNKDIYEGDLSGIMASKLPFWFHYLYKPGRKIAKTRDWQHKLDQMTHMADQWDIFYVAGVPAWVQLMFEKVIAHYKIKNIHEIWPNLSVFAHGGVAFEPYKSSFEKLLGKPIIFVETYLASEGFIALQTEPNKPMKFLLDNGIFFEFVPFNDNNFTEDGDLVAQPETYLIHQLKENTDYALLLSTVAGAWRYLIGDTIRIVDKQAGYMHITGRTKHFLSVCGEHLSVDNMNKAIQITANKLQIHIKEFTVAAVPYESMFAHHWFIGTDDKHADEKKIKVVLDEALKLLNDDYKTERISALKEVLVTILPVEKFYEFMRLQGKEGGQNKFPRVLRKTKMAEWQTFLGI